MPSILRLWVVPRGEFGRIVCSSRNETAQFSGAESFRAFSFRFLSFSRPSEALKSPMLIRWCEMSSILNQYL